MIAHRIYRHVCSHVWLAEGGSHDISCRRQQKRVLQVMPWEPWSEISALAAAYGVPPHAVYSDGPRFDNVSMQSLYEVRSNIGPHCEARAEVTTSVTPASSKSSSNKLKNSTSSNTLKWELVPIRAAVSQSSVLHGNKFVHKATQTDRGMFCSRRIL